MRTITVTCFLVTLGVVMLSAKLSYAKVQSLQSCPTGHHWVRPFFRRAYIRADGVSVSSSHVTAHCQMNPPAYAVWADRLKTGSPPGWLQKQEAPVAWSPEERERVLEALSALPPTLLIQTTEGIYRMLKSSLFELNPASGYDNEIALYDSAFGPKVNLARIIAHEFAHKAYRQLSVEDADSYNRAAQWLTIKVPHSKKYIQVPNRDAFVEEDGKEGPDEDFSNKFEYFLFSPSQLRAKTPKVYDWILKRYGDKLKLTGGYPK